MPWEKVAQGARGGVRRRAARASSSPRSSRRPSPPPRSARSTARRCTTARRVAVKIQYPGIAEALESDLAQRRHDRAAGEGARARARRQGGRRGAARAGAGGARLRVRGAEPAHLRPRLPRPPVHLRARSVHSRLSRRRVLVTELRRGPRLRARSRSSTQDERDRFGEIVFRFCFGSIYHLQHFNADTHPGNYLLMDDGRVAFLDFGMTKRLDREQIQLEQRAVDAAAPRRPGGAARGAARPRLRQRTRRSSTPSG